MGVCTKECTKERKGVTAAVLMATPCTNSLGGESGGERRWFVLKDRDATYKGGVKLK